jgi:hypothetical protein
VFSNVLLTHFGGFLLQRDCPGESAWFLLQNSREGEFYGYEPTFSIPPGLTTSPQAVTACPAASEECSIEE